MNKQLLAALFLAGAAGVAPAADAPDTVRVELQLLKNDSPVWAAATSSIEGQLTPVVSIEKRTYPGSCSFDKDGAPVIKPETLTTGVVAYVTPMHVGAEGTVVSVALSRTELTGMKTVTSNGCTVERPSTRVHEASAQVTIKPGEKTELPSFNGADKYVLVLRTL
jgi:hypothetical protein